METDSISPAEAWGGVAHAWDASADTNEGPTTEATARLIEWLAVQPGDRVLELAAGPGALGETWSQLVGPTGSAVLSDIAPAMVDAARRRNEHLDNVDAAVIDAAAIDLPGASFDIVACRMGLMFSPSPAIALAEMHRVLRPGGRTGILTWGGIEHNPWMTCVGMAAMANGLVSGGPPIGPGGIFSLADPTELEALAAGAGFSDVTVTTVEVAFTAPSIDAHLDRVSSLAGPLALALQAAPADRLAAFRRTATELVAPYLGAGGVEIPGVALLTTARCSTAP